MIKNTFWHIIIILSLVSCEEQINWDVKNHNSDILVVDGIITNELKQQNIHLSLVTDNLNDDVRNISNADITVSINNRTYTFKASGQSPGLYVSDSQFIANISNNIRLHIDFNNQVYEAQTGIIAVTPLDTLRYEFVPDTNMYKIKRGDEGTEAWIEYFIYNSNDELVFKYNDYYLGNIDFVEFFAPPPSETVYFKPGSKIVRRKYSITPDYKEFLRSMLMETEWRGGLFDVEPGLILSNISNGALGYFTASSVVSDTTYVY